jgi:ankyrin repeat protein
LDKCNQPNDPAAADRLLEDSTFDINARNIKGKSVAHLVLGTANVTTNRSKMIKSANAIRFLCRQNTDLTVADSSGMTPLHWCVKTANTEAARHLIERGIHINAVDKEGRTPLYLLGIDGSPVLEMAELLMRAGANLNGKRLLPLSGRPKEVQQTIRLWLSRVP